MEINHSIQHLLAKLKDGSISTKKLADLNALLNKENTAIDEIMMNDWNRTSGVNADINTSEVFTRLTHKLDLDTRYKTRSDSPFRDITSINFKPLLRYAAILLIGIVVGVAVHLYLARPIHTQYNEKYTTIRVEYGSKSAIELPDGSVVHLNSGSKLTYPAVFGNKDRTVTLTGEGFFEITENKAKPFYVNTNDFTVRVLGTTFNVRSYPDEKITETTLISGEVEIIDNQQSKPYEKRDVLAVLKPKQKARYTSDKKIEKSEPQPKQKNNEDATPGEPSIKVKEQDKLHRYTEWKNNILIIENEKFPELLKTLERWYNVDFNVQYHGLDNNRFTGKFDKETINQVLDALKLIEPFSYTMDKNKITITRE